MSNAIQYNLLNHKYVTSIRCSSDVRANDCEIIEYGRRKFVGITV